MDGVHKLEGASDSVTCFVIAGLVVRPSFNKSSSLSRTASLSSSLSRTSSDCVGNARAGLRQATAKTVWVWTKSKDVMTASVEGGWSTFIFTPETKDLANEWTCRCSSPFASLQHFHLSPDLELVIWPLQLYCCYIFVLGKLRDVFVIVLMS